MFRPIYVLHVDSTSNPQPLLAFYTSITATNQLQLSKLLAILSWHPSSQMWMEPGTGTSDSDSASLPLDGMYNVKYFFLSRKIGRRN